jgi:hypothetical protein
MHAFKEHHFLELQDDNGDDIGYTANELFEHTLESLNQTIDEETLIRHRMNQFKGHMD